MPYYIHPKGADPMTGVSYDDRATAYAKVKLDEVVTFIASPHEIWIWRRRERARFEDTTYSDIPWGDRVPLQLCDHYAHFSTETPGMIAYTIDAEHGIANRQTKIKPGRYLTQFYAGIFTPEKIAQYVAQCSAVQTELQLATSESDITKIYMHGPPSCMDGSHFKEMGVDRHPAIVYSHPSDLAVAYVGDLSADRVSQRCVIWPAKKRYTRIYGTGPLQAMLDRAGYEHASIAGARIRRIPYQYDYLLMPYVDSYTSEKGSPAAMQTDDDPDSDTLVLSEHHGSIELNETCGYVSAGDRDDEIDCNHCGRTISADDGPLCDRCQEEEWTCDHCNRSYFENNGLHAVNDEQWCAVNDEQWCNRCYERESVTCADDSCDRSWLELAEFDSTEHDQRIRRGTSDLCRSCADRYTWCELCETTYDTDVCPDCGRYAERCTHTADLSLDVVINVAPSIVSRPGAWRLEHVNNTHNGRVTVCHWYPNGQNCLAVGDYDDLVPLRDQLARLYQEPTYTYRIVPDTIGVWWRMADDCRNHITSALYWYKAPNGSTYYTHAREGWRLSSSVFDTLDNFYSAETAANHGRWYVRCFDPRPASHDVTAPNDDREEIEDEHRDLATRMHSESASAY